MTLEKEGNNLFGGYRKRYETNHAEWQEAGDMFKKYGKSAEKENNSKPEREPRATVCKRGREDFELGGSWVVVGQWWAETIKGQVWYLEVS